MTSTVVPTTPQRGGLRHHLRFTRDELPALFGVLGVVTFLHVAGWGLFLYYNSRPEYHSLTNGQGALVYAGAGALAYSFGLRHAFDADHISAIDDTTRLMLAKGKKPLAVGLFFSLGHSTIVMALSIGVAFAAKKAVEFQSSFADTGATIGASVSAFFLYLVGILNLVILVGIWKVWRKAKTGQFSHEHLEQLLNERGLMRRIFRGRFAKGFDHSWQLYPVGVLFGLGFDTATEVALLGISATAAVGTVGGSLPPLAIIALPLIFAAGMSMMDALDGIFMTKAYSWAFTSPLRKIFYNLTTTSLSIFVALVIGTVQLVAVLSRHTSIGAVEPFKTMAEVDLGKIGYFIVGSFVAAWLFSVVLWRVRRYEQRLPDGIDATEHSHREIHIDRAEPTSPVQRNL
ncbi:HoxN/HupN/NixA family nickel/cobalt transporter [Kineosporia sp. R_H_3]|uniref:HoxN/HupN/NixA family nickel/cobalt transporter n=1 Tax=Kineosporia sp. R_H_3 TaxID=1961848 RepID=UPI0018E9C214|nr:HoxN/HupN/NixA family nickel/cobalt transporter [Kineosporia sp. R_H_3]